VIHEVTRRVGRKGILITHSFGMLRVLRTAEMHRERISDVVVVGASRGPGIEGVRTHFISAWSALQPMLELPQLLRGIDLELIEAADLSSCEAGSAVNWAQTTDVEKPGCVGGSR
jgi:pimeloyl-ACP methyl ester carboxylesterase